MYGQDEWNVRQDDIYQPDLSDKPKKKKKGRFWATVGSGLLFGLCAGLMIWGVGQFMPQISGVVAADIQGKAAATEQPGDFAAAKPDASAAANTVETDQATDVPMSDLQEESDIAVAQSEGMTKAVVTDVTDVVDTVMPSVVSIFGTYSVTENFWGYAIRQEETGSGSGFIVGENEDELLLVTNNHVVADSTSLSVQFIDESIYDAVVKGTDADADLAVIAIKLSDLSAATKSAIRIATLGDSDNLKVGEPAIAIGNALGYGQSVTTGVISALNRDYSVDEDGNTQALIQTDAAINPGNSGGALLNVKGEVIGINSSKYSDTSVEGMGFAIPMATAKPILEDLIANGKTTTTGSPYLGIYGVDVTEDVSKQYNMPEGVYVAQIVDGSGAANAGITTGSIITKVDDTEVGSMEELKECINKYKVGDTVTVTVQIADGGSYTEKQISVTLTNKTY